jgi:cyanosortase A-associated protein
MEKVQVLLLSVIFCSVFLVLGRRILSPTTGNSKVTNTPISSFVFPSAVPLPQWQLLTSSPLAVTIVKNPKPEGTKYLSGRYYRYMQKGQTLDVEMRYMVHTDGDVKSFIKDYSSMPPSGQLTFIFRHRQGIGFYSLFAYQQRTYLSACINSRGGSTVTPSQFTLNRYIYDYFYDMRFTRLLSWVLGQQVIPDERCLWANLSIPLKNSSQTDANRILETAWLNWYQWWRPRFLKP